MKLHNIQGIMKKSLSVLMFMVVTMMLSCNDKGPLIQVDEVREVDFLNRTGDVIEGKLMGEIIGAQNIMIHDTLLFVQTSNPEGMLQIYGLSDPSKILGFFCKMGRANNEMSRISLIQAFSKDNHCYLIVVDQNLRICELDITASLENGYSVVTHSKMRPFVELGTDICLDNNLDYLLDYMPDYYSLSEGKQTKASSKFTLVKHDKQKELVFFESAMVTDEGFTYAPYRGLLSKHPSKNLAVFSFSYMDYLLFMDFDKKRYYASHQKGSMTHEGIYHQEAPWIKHFSASTATEKYFFVYYRNSDYSLEPHDGVFYPELLVFDWDGNYVNGFKMDRNSSSLAYDEKNMILYTLSTKTEQIYAYDMSSLLP